jgi:hypothetical protein
MFPLLFPHLTHPSLAPAPSQTLPLPRNILPYTNVGHTTESVLYGESARRKAVGAEWLRVCRAWF